MHRNPKRRWVVFRPGLDTALTLLSIPAFTAVYFFNANYGYDHPVIFFKRHSGSHFSFSGGYS